VRGERTDSSDGDKSLYQIMPLHTRTALQQDLGRWSNEITWEWVNAKTRVDERRLEQRTDGYHLINLSSQFDLQPVTLSFAANNVLNRYYEQPLGGVSIADFKNDMSVGFQPLAGVGRSFNFGVRYDF
ncbi:MAG: TonB-dependent receptor, partial [Oleibacter sp.]|nr:TonB-dependent receptor [Thalassolituus sp.]